MGYNVEGRRPDIVFRPFVSEVDWKWFHAHVPISFCSDARGIVALRKGIPVAGAVLQNWMPYSVEIHHVLLKPTVLRHGWLELLEEASFGHAGLVPYSLISEGRANSLKFHKRIGFKETGRVPGGDGPGVDLVVLSCQRQDFKNWKESRHGWS